MKTLNGYSEGEEVYFRHCNNHKWKLGRIKKIEVIPNMISHFQIEQFQTNAKVLDWEVILAGIERGQEENFIDTDGKEMFKFVDGYFPVKWFSEKYIKKIEE